MCCKYTVYPNTPLLPPIDQIIPNDLEYKAWSKIDWCSHISIFFHTSPNSSKEIIDSWGMHFQVSFIGTALACHYQCILMFATHIHSYRYFIIYIYRVSCIYVVECFLLFLFPSFYQNFVVKAFTQYILFLFLSTEETCTRYTARERERKIYLIQSHNHKLILFSSLFPI